jgi:hypothetical protein
MAIFFNRLAKHTAIAMAGGTAVALLFGMLLISVLERLNLHELVRRSHCEWNCALIWLPGFVLGFLINRRMRHRAACFVLIPGLIWLFLGVLETIASWKQGGKTAMAQVQSDLFPTTQSDYASCGSTECLGQLVYTWPALNALTYSLGAAAGLLSRRGEANADEPSEVTTIELQ